MIKYRSLVELKLNPNIQALSLTPDPTILLPKFFFFDSMYTKERTHLLQSNDVESNIGIKDGSAVTMPNGILRVFKI